jgi:hypothetical protein
VSFQSGTKAIAVLVVLGTTLAACSEIYVDRRETVSLGAGDAIASNKVTMMTDPWPRHSANKQIAFNGERMQASVERYRHGKTYIPVNVTTSSAAYQQAQQQAAAQQAATSQATSNAPAAPVKGP